MLTLALDVYPTYGAVAECTLSFSLTPIFAAGSSTQGQTVGSQYGSYTRFLVLEVATSSYTPRPSENGGQTVLRPLDERALRLLDQAKGEERYGRDAEMSIWLCSMFTTLCVMSFRAFR